MIHIKKYYFILLIFIDNMKSALSGFWYHLFVFFSPVHCPASPLPACRTVLRKRKVFHLPAFCVLWKQRKKVKMNCTVSFFFAMAK